MKVHVDELGRMLGTVAPSWPKSGPAPDEPQTDAVSCFDETENRTSVSGCIYSEAPLISHCDVVCRRVPYIPIVKE